MTERYRNIAKKRNTKKYHMNRLSIQYKTNDKGEYTYTAV